MPSVGAIILAAGMARRMGQPKLLMSLNGKPLFRYPLEVAVKLKLNPIVFIGGYYTEVFQKKANDLGGVEFIQNVNFETGMSSSLKLGMERIKGRCDGVLIFLADQPFVPGRVVLSLIKYFEVERGKGTLIVRPVYDGTPGHPILFDASLMDEFYSIEGDQGGRAIVASYRNQTRLVPFEDSLWGVDIDTPEDFLALKNKSD